MAAPSAEPAAATQRPTVSKARRRWRCVGIATGVAAILFAICVLQGCDTWFYYPSDEIHRTPESFDWPAENVYLRAPDGPRIHGWWVPAKGKPRGTVVFCHGNHGNLTVHAASVRWLHDRGFNLLIFDYRGFGQSEGTVDREGTVDDAVAAIDFALARDPARTFVFGHSLGGAVGLVAAARRTQVRAVAVESTFPSYRAAARCTAPWLSYLVPMLVSKGVDPVDSVSKLSPRPLLVIHGTADEITPVELGRELFDRAAEPKTWHPVDGGGHRTPWFENAEEFERLLIEFFLGALR